MATYASGSVTFAGLSGVDVDFDDLINKLYQIESIQANKLLEWYSDWEIRLDAFSQVRDSLVAMQSALSSINSTDKFLVKTAISSNDSVVGATTTSEAAAGSYSVEVNQLATSSVWSLGTGLSDKTAVVNSSSDTGTFTYVYKGESRTISVPSGTTLEQLKNLINNDGENLGVRVQLIQSGDEIVFQLSGLDTGAAATLEISNTANLNGLGLGTQENLWNYNNSFEDLTGTISYGSTTEAINTTEGSRSFMFDVNGSSYTVKLAKGGSLDDLVNSVNAIQGDTGVTASAHDNGDGTYSLRLVGASGDLITVGGGSLEGYSTMLTTSTWQTQAGQNAQVRVQGWPATGWLEVDSNTLDGVVDGVTFNLRAEGKATVTVELDTAAIQENVQKFVDAVNQFRSLIKNLTKVEEDTAIDPDYAETQSEMQNGSALTGNYGIQLISSNLKQAVAGAAKGFSYQQEIEGKMFGDLFTSLAQIGIITDSEESSDTFGMLIINTSTSSDGTTYVNSTSTMTLAEALAKDATAVAKLFASDGEARSNNSAFGVNSTVKTITGAGTYDVSYTVDASGAIESATINGKDAKVTGSQISLVQTPTSSDSSVAGVSSSGLVDAEYEVSVRWEAAKALTEVAVNAAAPDEVVYSDPGGGTMDFTYLYNGESRTIEVSNGTTLEALAKTINKDSGNLGVAASVVENNGVYNLVLEAKETGDNGAIDIMIDAPSSGGSGALTGASTASATGGRNAEYKVWEKGGTEPAEWTVSESNNISLGSGVAMTLMGTGTASLKVQKNNNADGIIIDVYDLTPGNTVTGSVSIRQGKVNELLAMLEGTSGILGSEGTLAILENNYKEIMANIKDKIQKEDERLQKWERLTRLRFSRLETTLATYQNLQASIESQIAQLSSD